MKNVLINKNESDNYIEIISNLNNKANAEIFLRTRLSNIKIKDFCYDEYSTSNEDLPYSVFVTTIDEKNYKIKIYSNFSLIHEMLLSIKIFDKIRQELILEAKNLIK